MLAFSDHQFISFHLHLRVKWHLEAEFPIREKVVNKSARKRKARTALSQQQIVVLGLRGWVPRPHLVSASEPPARSDCQAPKHLSLRLVGT